MFSVHCACNFYVIFMCAKCKLSRSPRWIIKMINPDWLVFDGLVRWGKVGKIEIYCTIQRLQVRSLCDERENRYDLSRCLRYFIGSSHFHEILKWKKICEIYFYIHVLACLWRQPRQVIEHSCVAVNSFFLNHATHSNSRSPF
jgi:hypothetical protein